jgi:glycine dehydrogenase subunit 2
VIRHYVNLSQLNYSVDTGFYPLGSCTMKYNPKLNEWAARLDGFASLHPLAPDATAQGTLQLLWELEAILAEVSGMDAVTLQPAAGAHGELTGLLMIRAYHRSRGDGARTDVLVPDSSHGTNPATATMAGFRTITIPSAPDGGVDIEAFQAALGPTTAAIMITNPSTLGLFEARVGELLEATHAAGALAYMDGANLNATMGRFRPGAAGFDVMHFNTHKTFSTPHGGGGPGAGPVCVRKHLEPFLPVPRVVVENGVFRWSEDFPLSIGKLQAFWGNMGILIRAYSYIMSLGAQNLQRASELAVLNANYIKERLKGTYQLEHDRICMHECVFSDKLQQAHKVSTLDIAKRLMDYGFHPPTIYFPLVVPGAIMIEPTETESKENLDLFVASMQAIAAEARDNPEALHQAPTRCKRRRLDETAAARKPCLSG